MSLTERSITLSVLDAIPGTTLEFGSATASDGPLPSPSAPAVAPGKTMTVTAKNGSGGCTGSFMLSGGGAVFLVSYNHPEGAGATTVGVSAGPGWLSGSATDSYGGHDVSAALHLYRGVPANAQGGYAVPLGLLATPPEDNAQDFVNSMFGPNMRSAAQITTAYGNPAPNGYVTPADFTGGQMAGFVKIWTSQWLDGPDPACPPADAKLLALLARYVQTASAAGWLQMWIPQITYQAGTSPSVFSLTGYTPLSFEGTSGGWNEAAVSAFLSLLAAGAHFVFVCADDDMPPGVSVTPLDQVFSASELPSRHDPGNSHYASVVNTTGTYYLGVTQDFAPPGCGLVLSFLMGRTVNDALAKAGKYNVFAQLEGWQAGTSWHDTDYDTYKATLWNISTYGACPYSEKRATTVFLAPPGWTPQVYQTTCMMPYVGAYATTSSHGPTPQPWLDTAMVQIPKDAPPLPERYILDVAADTSTSR